jgi:hypothetical protein
MTHILRVTDGTTTISISDVSTGDVYWSEYTPQVSADHNAPLREKVSIRLINTISTARDNVNSLNRLFAQAQAYQDSRTGPRVYVEFDPGNTGSVYRSQLYSGAVKPVTETLKTDWRVVKVGYELEWERQPFWEGPLTQVPLTNSGGTANTSGLTVTNVNDSTGENWVDVAAEYVLGDLPSPIKVQMVNATNADATDEIYFWHNVYSYPTSFPHIVEAESSVGGSVTPSGTTTCSGGTFAVISWGTATETMIAEYNLSATTLGYAAGGRFAILARWHGLFPYSDCWLRVKLETPTNYYPVTIGNLSLVSPIASGRELVLLDTMRLPPYLEGQTSQQALVLRLYAQRTGGGTINMDYLQLSPIAGWMRFKSAARGVPYQSTFVYDGPEERTYYADGSNNWRSEFAQYGEPILLTPNADQRLYFNTSDYLGNAKIDQEWTVKAWYRPRRDSI